MDENYHDPDELDLLDDEEIEAYCVHCKTKVEMEDPIAVWTSQGRPGVRGDCPICGHTIFRMGRSHLHGSSAAPKPIQVVTPGTKGRAARAAYIASDATQAHFAAKLGEDLKKIGVNMWVDNGEAVDETRWAGGVHPALEQCSHLIVILSSFSAKTASVGEAWKYFLRQRKPVVVVQVEEVDPPDELRSRPRFNFMSDYKTAFRGLVEALSR
jgi:NAD-dependent SIR2 family protein deacetylase